MEQIYNLHLQLIGKNDRSSFQSNSFSVKFFDKDLIKDDFLGEGTPDSQGNVTIALTASKFRGKDTPLELNPDVYFVVFEGDKEIYRSPVLKDLNLKKLSEFTTEDGMNFNLGTFVI